MLEESASAIWESMNSWLTPTVLFVLLNLMIGTIAFTSTISNQKQHDSHHPNSVKPLSVLQRVKSINFSTHFRSQEPLNHSVHHKPNPDSDSHFEAHSHYFFQDNSPENSGTPQPQAHFDLGLEKTGENQTGLVFEHIQAGSVDDIQPVPEEKNEENGKSMGEVKDNHFSRTKSDTEPASGDIPSKLPSRMRKSASLKSAFAHFEEEEIVEVRRPATVREKGNAKVTDGDEEVDAKADDFINKFKQQLKLQRLDSIIRYKDMIGRGSGGI